MSKLNVDKHISVEIELDKLDLTSAESKATYGLDVREHYNISSNEDQKVPQYTIEKEEAILDALKHFKMIE